MADKEVLNDKKLDEGVTVDLNKEPASKKEEPKYVTLDDLNKITEKINKSIENSRFYINRKLDEYQKSVAPLEKKPSAEPKSDNYDELLEQNNWRTPVKGLAREEAKEVVREYFAEIEAQKAAKETEAKRVEIYEKSQSSVLEKYPDLSDSSSDNAKRYIKIVNNHPEYLKSEFGPILAMRDMEEELRSEGLLDEASKKNVDKEIERRTRVNAASVPRGTVSHGGKIVLSKEQKEFCDYHNIKYEDYAAQAIEPIKNGAIR